MPERRDRHRRHTIASWSGWCWSGSVQSEFRWPIAFRVPHVLETLIEATYTRRRTGLLARANLGIEKLRFLVRLAGDLSHLDRRRYEYAARCLDETGRKVGAWSKAYRARESPQLV